MIWKEKFLDFRRTLNNVGTPVTQNTWATFCSYATDHHPWRYIRDILKVCNTGISFLERIYVFPRSFRTQWLAANLSGVTLLVATMPWVPITCFPRTSISNSQESLQGGRNFWVTLRNKLGLCGLARASQNLSPTVYFLPPMQGLVTFPKGPSDSDVPTSAHWQSRANLCTDNRGFKFRNMKPRYWPHIRRDPVASTSKCWN